MTATDTSYYGAYQYGNFFYGVSPSLVHQSDFFVAMSASVLSYTSVQINWGRPHAPNIVELSLRRNKFNFPNDFNTPVDSDDGVEVFNGSPGNVTSFVDTSVSSGFYYYTLFGLDSTVSALTPGQSTGPTPWRRLGQIAALVPLAYNYGSFLYNRLPAWYRDNDLIQISGTPISTDMPLSNFMSLLGFQVDQIRSYADSLLLVNDAQNCSGVLLPYLCQELGMPFEIKMGMAQVRNLAQNAVHLYRKKGTAPGISEFASNLTGWPVQTVFMGPNRLLSIDDGVFVNSTGAWTFPTTPTVSGFPAISIPTNGNAAVTIATAALPGSDPSYNNSGVSATTTTGLKVSVISAPTNSNLYMVGQAVPAQDFTDDEGVGTVNFPLWVWPTAAGQTVHLLLYNEAGTLLNSNSTGLSAGAANLLSLTTALNLSTDPDQTKWLIPIVQIVGAANGNNYFFTQIALYDGTAPTLYDLPRDLKVIVEPQTANLFGNPLTFTSRFPYGLDGWISTAASNNLGVVAPSALTLPFGAGALQVSTVNVSGTYEIPQVQGGQITTLTVEPNFNQHPSNFENIPMAPDVPQTLSVYVVALGPTVGKTFQLGVNFLLSSGQTVTALSGPLTSTGTFQRYSFTAVAPFNVVGGTGFFQSLDATLTASDVFLLNSAMFEATATLDPYFDIWTSAINPDYRLGANGQSMFYESLGVKLPRLETLLPQWIPAGATYTVTLSLGATVPGSSTFTPAAGVTFPLVLPVVI